MSDSESFLNGSIAPLQQHDYLSQDGHWLRNNGEKTTNGVSKTDCCLTIPELVYRNIGFLCNRLLISVVDGIFVSTCIGRIVTPENNITVDLEDWASRTGVLYVDITDLVPKFHREHSPNPDLLQDHDTYPP